MSTYRITHDSRVFNTLAAAKRALLSAAYDNMDTDRIMSRPRSIPAWCVSDDSGNICCWAEDLVEEDWKKLERTETELYASLLRT